VGGDREEGKRGRTRRRKWKIREKMLLSFVRDDLLKPIIRVTIHTHPSTDTH
jgi:hypothetical protein